MVQDLQSLLATMFGAQGQGAIAPLAAPQAAPATSAADPAQGSASTSPGARVLARLRGGTAQDGKASGWADSLGTAAGGMAAVKPNSSAFGAFAQGFAGGLSSSKKAQAEQEDRALKRLMLERQLSHDDATLALARDRIAQGDRQFQQTVDSNNQWRKDQIEERRQNRVAPQAGYEQSPDGSGQRYIVGGPADPKVIAAQAEARAEVKPAQPLDKGAITELAEKGKMVSDVTRFNDTFDDSFGGNYTGFIGDTKNAIARNTGIGNTKAATWWQDYDKYKNVTRNQLFGSALTAHEAAAFEKADINPGMTPQTIRDNLKLQRDAATSAAKKWVGVYAAQGRDPAEIEAAAGIPMQQLGIEPKKRGQRSDAAAPVPTSRILGKAPANVAEGATSTLSDGRKVVIRGGNVELAD